MHNMSDKCMECGAKLSGDEIGLYRRLINKYSQSYKCISCMSKYFACSESLLKNKIKHFKNIGCLFFEHEEI